MAKCYKHEGADAVAKCSRCGKDICKECSVDYFGKTICTDCGMSLLSLFTNIHGEPKQILEKKK